MSLLDYLSSSINKPGRAVRGLLAGNPGEALAAVPFSDSLGLTNEDDAVSGHDLLKLLGADPGDGIGGTLAGVAVDAATDPLTYVGGALAKRLLGGGFKTVGKTAADFLPEGEFALDNRYGMMADGLFPGEVGKLNRAAKGLPEELAPLPAGGPEMIPGADATMPGGELIRQLPHPSEYYPHLPIEQMDSILAEQQRLGRMAPPLPAYNPSALGIPGDHVLDKDPLGASGALLSGWDRVIADMERLHPDARAELGQSMPWGWVMGQHADDLAGMTRLRGAMPGMIADRAGEQLQQLQPHLHGNAYGGAAKNFSDDLVRGNVMPSEVIHLAERTVPFLPLQDRPLKAMAAAGQEEAMNSRLVSQLTHIPNNLGFDADTPIRDLVGNTPSPEGLLRELVRAVDPGTYERFEGNIVHRVLQNPTNGFARIANEEIRGAIPAARGEVLDRIAAGDPEMVQALHQWAERQQVPPYPSSLRHQFNILQKEQQAREWQEYLRTLPPNATAAQPANRIRELIESFDPVLVGNPEAENIVRSVLESGNLPSNPAALQGFVHRHLRPLAGQFRG